MKHSLSLAILLGITALFQGCGETEETATVDTQTVISGTTTIKSSRFDPDKATVCLDLNENNICNDNEPQTLTNEIGDYKILVPEAIKDGTIIIATGGYSLILNDDQNRSVKNIITMHKNYKKSETAQNVNIMSHIVYLDMKQNSSTYSDALENIANKYNYNGTDILLQDPIRIALEDKGFVIDGPGVEYYYNAIAIEAYISEQLKSHSSPAPMRAGSLTTEDDTIIPGLTDLTIDTDLFDSYLETLSAYFEAIWDYLFGGDDVIEEDSGSGDGTTEETGAPTTIPVTRDAMNAIWYIIDASGDKTCSDIDSGDNISVTEADGKTTDLTLTYTQDGTLASLKLSLSFFSVDTIVITDYKDDNTFTGYYASDNETLQGEIVDNLATCKSGKLGL